MPLAILADLRTERLGFRHRMHDGAAANGFHFPAQVGRLAETRVGIPDGLAHNGQYFRICLPQAPQFRERAPMRAEGTAESIT